LQITVPLLNFANLFSGFVFSRKVKVKKNRLFNSLNYFLKKLANLSSNYAYIDSQTEARKALGEQVARTLYDCQRRENLKSNLIGAPGVQSQNGFQLWTSRPYHFRLLLAIWHRRIGRCLDNAVRLKQFRVVF